jgi:putative radical SAM enzyme (TIGR03279 family)
MPNPTVIEIVSDSPAAEAGLSVGAELVAVNGMVPSDVIEYQQLVDDADPELTIRDGDGQRIMLLNKNAGEPLGIRLSSSIFDRVQTCDNHCEFCFIYQLPHGMRESLYLKDDDYRLSFLYGNFTTLTRFTELDLARVVEERLGPLYVSIHATDPEVRTRMLRNPRGATSLRWLRALLDHEVTIHGQVVLCPGINAGSVLDRTAAELLARHSGLASVGIVPLGLSRYNAEENLRVHTPEEAAADLDTIHFWQEEAMRRIGRRLFFASDELYLVANRPIPKRAAYEDFSQHENGIGMIRTFIDEIETLSGGGGAEVPVATGEWRTIPSAPGEGYRAPRHTGSDPPAEDGPVGVLTGMYGAAALEPLIPQLERLSGRSLHILAVQNRFFGGNTAVAGLLVGTDVKEAIAGSTSPVARYLLPDVALSGDVFLDDMSLGDLRAASPVPIIVTPATAKGLIEGAAT